MARSRTPLRVSAAGASSSLRAWASPSAGVLPSLPLAIGRFTPSTGLPDTALFAEIIEQGGQRRELAPDAGGPQAAGLEVLAPGDDMRPRDRAPLRGSAQAGAGRNLAHVNFIGASRFGIGDVGEPF